MINWRIVKKIFGTFDYSDKYPELTLVPMNIGDRRFWKFPDDKMIPVLRATEYINLLKQSDERVNLEDYKSFCNMIDAKIDSFFSMQEDGKTLQGVKNLAKVKNLTEVMRRKCDMFVDVDLIYRLASVLFISENETPYEYCYDLQDEKIKYFKGQGQYFFYNLPVKQLLPPSLTSHESYQNYTQLLMEEQEKLENFLTQIQSS